MMTCPAVSKRSRQQCSRSRDSKSMSRLVFIRVLYTHTQTLLYISIRTSSMSLFFSHRYSSPVLKTTAAQNRKAIAKLLYRPLCTVRRELFIYTLNNTIIVRYYIIVHRYDLPSPLQRLDTTDIITM